jgi:hypothetical protein
MEKQTKKDVTMKMKIPAVYCLIDSDTDKVLEKMICFTKEDAIKIGHKLATLEVSGLIKLKRHKNLLNRWKGYGKYTTLKGVNIPIVEYDFMPNKIQGRENGKR